MESEAFGAGSDTRPSDAPDAAITSVFRSPQHFVPSPTRHSQLPTPSSPLDLLARDDKWQLGGGDGIIFAPTFPVWLDVAGFWDDATIYQYAFGPLFTVTLLDGDGRELPLRALSRRWTPAELTVDYRLPDGMFATEVRTVQPGGIFVSEWRVRAPRPTSLHMVAWTAQELASVDPHSVRWTGALTFTRAVVDRREVPLRVVGELTCMGEATSWAASACQGEVSRPQWSITPFVERWGREGLARTIRVDGIDRQGLLYAAVHRATPLGIDEGNAVFAMRLAPADDSLRSAHASAAPVRAPSPPSQYAGGTLRGTSRRRWTDLFARAPSFRCSDPYFEKYYWYRWYGLWLNSIAPGVGNYQHPSMCEGVGPFHQPISYSAQCHARELRWLDDPREAQGIFRTFFSHQKADGSLHGRIYLNHLEGTDFYHANWGDALLALDAVAPDDAFIAEMYFRLARYADWLIRTRDRETSGMFDVIDQFETGQEYMSRYQAVDVRADRYGWENRIRLKGIDATVYAFALFRALEQIARRSGESSESTRWAVQAARTAHAVRTHMWDAEAGMFSDVNPVDGRRTGTRAAVCFYPYFTDLATDEHLPGFERALLDPERFWTPFPVPSSAIDDPQFDAFAEWKGKRHGCPWNGRVWPMTNSHIIEALAHQATHRAPRLRAHVAHLLQRFVRMMFHDGDVERPNCHEHYNPVSGAASVYRGIDDYQHSWVNDFILRFVTGVQPHAGGVTIDPYPFGLEHAEVTGVKVRGATVAVRVSGGSYTVTIEGKERTERLGTPIEVAR